MEGVPGVSVEADRRVSVSDDRMRVSIEERRGGGGASFEYSRRARQSADIKRSVAAPRASNGIKVRPQFAISLCCHHQKNHI